MPEPKILKCEKRVLWLCNESADLRALRAFCLITWLLFYVLSCLTWVVPYMLYCLMFRLSYVHSCLTCLMHNVSRTVRALVTLLSPLTQVSQGQHTFVYLISRSSLLSFFFFFVFLAT